MNKQGESVQKVDGKSLYSRGECLFRQAKIVKIIKAKYLVKGVLK